MPKVKKKTVPAADPDDPEGLAEYMPKTHAFLKSSRYNFVDTPITTYEFYDTYISSTPAALAIEAGEQSTKGKNLVKYLDKTKAIYDADFHKTHVNKGSPPVPEHIKNLLALQSRESGKFENMHSVKRALLIPPAVDFGNKLYKEEEKATALAIAALRQHNNLFDILQDAHDKASRWISSNELIYEAREMLTTFQFLASEEDYPELKKRSRYSDNSTDSSSQPSQFSSPSPSQSHTPSQSATGAKQSQLLSASLHASSSGVTNSSSSTTEDSSEIIGGGDGGEVWHAEDNGEQAVQQAVVEDNNRSRQYSNVNISDLMLDTLVEDEDDEDDDDDDDSVAAMLKSIPKHDNEHAGNSGHNGLKSQTSSGAFSAADLLSVKLEQLTASRDEMKIAKQKQVTDRVTLKVVSLVEDIERVVQQILECKNKCTQKFLNSETCTIRYTQFDELTCMLGDGHPPTEGFTDFRQHGVPGIRPLVIEFFNQVQLMAEARLLLEELETPEGRGLDAVNNVQFNVSRWTLVWNGYDVVLKVVHCLDFLRKCRELVEWYGPSFYFVANPLMIPYTPYRVLNMVDGGLIKRVEDQQRSVPHLRLGTLIMEKKNDWEQEAFINKWRREMTESFHVWAFNWPALPVIKETEACERLYTSFLVMFIKCRDSIERSAKWEKAFISKIATLRGMNALLDGEKTFKEDKPLNIPKEEDRKAKPFNLTLMGQQTVKKQGINGRKARLVFLGAGNGETNYGGAPTTTVGGGGVAPGRLDMSKADRNVAFAAELADKLLKNGKKKSDFKRYKVILNFKDELKTVV